MIKHIYKHQIKIGDIVYRPNGQGELYLPERIEWANPVEEKKEKKKVERNPKEDN